MKIEVFAICYNEEALLPYFLRHYSTFCHKITIYDNMSTDRSREICRANPITNIIPYDSGNQIRDDIYLQIKNNCWKASDADWVIVCDIDEFVYHPYIHTVLSGIKATIVIPEWFNMFSKEFPSTPGQIWEEVTCGMPGGAKQNLFRPSQIQEINYNPGCHECYPSGNIIRETSSGIKTLHMKNLSEQYTMSRIVMSRERLSTINKENGWGFHYNFPEEEIKRYHQEGLLNAVKVI